MSYLLCSLGRKPTVLLSHTVYFLAGLATLFAPNFTLLAILRFLVGCAHHTVSHLPFLIGKHQLAPPLLFLTFDLFQLLNTVECLAAPCPSWWSWWATPLPPWRCPGWPWRCRPGDSWRSLPPRSSCQSLRAGSKTSRSLNTSWEEF